MSYVVDGDTIRLEGGEKVRLVGVDTPELLSSDPDEKQRALEAKQFTENFCQAGENVGLDVDDLRPRDDYGRTLAIVYVEVDNFWVNLNAELLRRGYARIMFISPSEFNPHEWAS